jgi:hypothetical protein
MNNMNMYVSYTLGASLFPTAYFSAMKMEAAGSSEQYATRVCGYMEVMNRNGAASRNLNVIFWLFIKRRCQYSDYTASMNVEQLVE